MKSLEIVLQISGPGLLLIPLHHRGWGWGWAPPPPSEYFGPNFLRACSRSSIFSGAFSANLFRPQFSLVPLVPLKTSPRGNKKPCAGPFEKFPFSPEKQFSDGCGGGGVRRRSPGCHPPPPPPWPPVTVRHGLGPRRWARGWSSHFLRCRRDRADSLSSTASPSPAPSLASPMPSPTAADHQQCLEKYQLHVCPGRAPCPPPPPSVHDSHAHVMICENDEFPQHRHRHNGLCSARTKRICGTPPPVSKECVVQRTPFSWGLINEGPHLDTEFIGRRPACPTNTSVRTLFFEDFILH